MIYVIYGVSGSGKSTIGRALASALELPFYDADDFHPYRNVEKMRAGIALQDDDRWPWLERLRDGMPRWEASGGAGSFTVMTVVVGLTGLVMALLLSAIL